MATIYAPNSTVFNQGPLILPSLLPPANPPPPTPGIAFVPLGALLWYGLFGQAPRKAYLKSVDVLGGTVEMVEETGTVTKVDTKTSRIYINAPYSTINNYEYNSYNSYNTMYNPYVNAPGSNFNVYGRKIDTSIPLIAITNQNY